MFRCCFFGKLKTPKFPSEISWPLLFLAICNYKSLSHSFRPTRLFYLIGLPTLDPEKSRLIAIASNAILTKRFGNLKGQVLPYNTYLFTCCFLFHQNNKICTYQKNLGFEIGNSELWIYVVVVTLHFFHFFSINSLITVISMPKCNLTQGILTQNIYLFVFRTLFYKTGNRKGGGRAVEKEKLLLLL